MFREIMYVLGLSNWCKVVGVVRNVNEGMRKPFNVPIIHYVEHEELD